MSFADSALADSPVNGRWLWLSRLLFFGIGLIAFCTATSATDSRAIIIQNDKGGAVTERAELIRDYRSAGTSVEIRGSFCLSSCTMYLGLPETCVTPQTVFGFHGPSSRHYGIALNPAAFEHWSQIMADHYPEPLRSWFLSKGRHRIVGFYEYLGSDLIRMGIRRCIG